jgi:N-acetylglucosaminyldiphosphoundecaprenol N-acetyl-beta-D-mannosaminyltransferase
MIRPGFPSYNVFGYKLTPTTLDEQLLLLEMHVEAGQQCVLANLNLHGLHTLRRDRAMAVLHNMHTTYVSVDGMPLIWLCRLAGVRATSRHRVTYVDLIWPLLSLAERKHWRVYYVGSTATVLARATRVIRSRLPNLEFRAHHGYFGINVDTVVADIVTFKADIVIVGMGMPLQERWILAHMGAVAPACILPGGAVMEYVAGAVRTPPRWLGRIGLEWLFRLAENPQRFWWRYLIEPWQVGLSLATYVARKYLGLGT